MRHAARAAGQYSSAFSFSRGGSKKRIKVFASVCTGSCRPPMWPADMIRNRLADARRFRTATAHSAYALYVVMPFPLGFASLKRSAVRIPTIHAAVCRLREGRYCERNPGGVSFTFNNPAAREVCEANLLQNKNPPSGGLLFWSCWANSNCHSA